MYELRHILLETGAKNSQAVVRRLFASGPMKPKKKKEKRSKHISSFAYYEKKIKGEKAGTTVN